MAVGQGVLAPVLDVGALIDCEGRIELLALDRCAAHGARLRLVLRVHGVFVAAGCRESTTAHLALLEQTSERAASALLDQAVLLDGLPGGLEAVECGLLSGQQAAAVTRALLPASDEVRLAVWQRLQARLLAALEEGSVLPPGRLTDLVTGWVVAADAEAAAERRRAAYRDGGVSWRRRDDGLVDISVFGVRGPDAQAVLSRIRDRSRPWGGDDDRTAEARRRDAAVDLWLGRDQQPVRDGERPFDVDDAAPCPRRPRGRAGGAAPCGCRPGEVVPCGVGVTLLLPLGCALGTTDEVAVLEGHGPLEPDLARAVLHRAPAIRPVWVDAGGVPVAVGDRTTRPPRGDPAAVRQALLALAAGHPTRLQPRHPDDHDPDPALPALHRDARGGVPAGGPPLRSTAPAHQDWPAFPGLPVGQDRHDADGGRVRLGWWAPPVRRPRLLTGPHPLDAPGTYRPSVRIARLVRARSPRCEWPGCGAWAVRCDLDHTVAHPCGPTCSCNLGPACRHHHRLKQTAWSPSRAEDGVRWTAPTGRTWLSPSQHEPLQPPARPLPALPDLRGPGDPSLSEDGSTDHAWLSGRADRLRADDPQACDTAEPDADPVVLVRDAGWGLALDDHTRWTG